VSRVPGAGRSHYRVGATRRVVAAPGAELEARLKVNASNSPTPPSANPPGAPPPVRKPKSKRKRGGQPGHPPHLKRLLPPERVTRTEIVVPASCAACRQPLPPGAGPDDPPPKRFQTVELPPIVAEVVEYQAQARTCRCCGAVTHAALPAALHAHSVGPRLTATLSYFSGCHGVSKRGVEEIAEAVFGVPVALGTVANLEQEVGAALGPAHGEALAAVRQAAVKYADETSWKVWASCAGCRRPPRRRSPPSSSMPSAACAGWRRCWANRSKALCTATAGTPTTGCRRTAGRRAGRT
jgi:transposase